MDLGHWPDASRAVFPAAAFDPYPLLDASMVALRWSMFRICTATRMEIAAPNRLTNRSSQPLAVAMRRFDFMKQPRETAMLVSASGGSAPSR